MFGFTVCMLPNLAPPPFAVSKHASVTLPLKPVTTVVCWKDTEMPSLHGPSAFCQPCVIRSPSPVIFKIKMCHTSDQVTSGQTWPPQKNPSLSEPCGNLISERGKHVNNKFSQGDGYTGKAFFLISCVTMKKRFGFCCFISANL